MPHMPRYCILDPTGNITALVEEKVEISQQPKVARDLMRLHPSVEQVGFVQYGLDVHPSGSAHINLRMAGGEFCGNATMCAAYLYAMRNGLCDSSNAGTHTILVQVSGVSRPLESQVTPVSSNSAHASIHMPKARSIREVSLCHGSDHTWVPLVDMPGIAHAVILCDSPFQSLMQRPQDAESAVRAWCKELGTEGLGLMFLNDVEISGEDVSCVLTPLVYIPGADTVYWENSCASGSAATGMCLNHMWQRPLSLVLHEPGGNLRVISDGDDTALHGNIRILETEGTQEEFSAPSAV